MPALPAVPNALKVEFTINDSGGIDAGSRFFLSYSGSPPNTTDLNLLATEVRTAWGTELKAHSPTEDTFESVKVTDLSSDTGAIGTDSTTIDGTSGSGPLPAGVCACVNHTINRRYRGGHPKTFLRTGTVTDLDGSNKWGDTFLSTILTAWQAWIAAIIATSGMSITIDDIVNISYYQSFTPVPNPVTGRTRDVPKLRTGGPVVDVITDSTVRPKLGSQRRRLD